MAEMNNQRRRLRIGVVLCAFMTGFAAMMMGDAGLHGAIAEPLMLIPLATLITGVGLIAGIRLARIPGLLLWLGLAGITVYEVLLVLVHWAGYAAWDADTLMALANLLASAALQLWLDIRAIQILLDRPLPETRATTARVAGGALAIIAIWHLVTAFELGLDWRGASMTVSATATHLLGFPGWPAWHLALLLVASCLLLGRGRLLHHAATGLMLLFILLGPLLIYNQRSAPTQFGPMPLDVAVVALCAMVSLVPAYLAWWLRDEVSPPTRA